MTAHVHDGDPYAAGCRECTRIEAAEPVTLVVRVARTEEQTVTLEVERRDGEDADDLADRYDAEITEQLPWSDWDLLSAEVRT